MLSIADTLKIRHMSSLTEARTFLEGKGILPDEVSRYLPLVGQDVDSTTPRVLVLDPLRHRMWGILHILGCSLRSIASVANVHQSTVWDAIRKLKDAEGDIRPSTRRSLHETIHIYDLCQRHRTIVASGTLHEAAGAIYDLYNPESEDFINER